MVCILTLPSYVYVKLHSSCYFSCYFYNYSIVLIYIRAFVNYDQYSVIFTNINPTTFSSILIYITTITQFGNLFNYNYCSCIDYRTTVVYSINDYNSLFNTKKENPKMQLVSFKCTNSFL